MTALLESEADARALPEVRAAFEAARARTGDRGVLTARARAMLATALEGVPLGAYEEHMLLDWLPGLDIYACAVVATVIRRARETGPATREDDTDD